MPVDPRLDSVLRALLKPPRPQTTASETSRIYAASAAVLTTLTNPLNVTLLTTQILIAPAIWQAPDGLHSALRTFGTFQSATLGKVEARDQTLGLEEWINAVVRGANYNVPRWKHLLLLGGLLSAFEKNSYLSRVTRRSLEDAFVRAVNLSLEANKHKELESDVLTLILSHSIEGLSAHAKKLINYDALLSVVARSIYHSKDGFQSGYFLSKIDNDVVNWQGKLAWPSKSNSLIELQERLGRPLFTSMSGVARLAGAALRNARDPNTIHNFLDKVLEFSQTLTNQWKMNRLSEISQLDEPRLIDPESLKHTLPVVWQILKMVLFTTALMLQELAIRLVQSPELTDTKINSDIDGPSIASKILHILRGFYFITIRLGPSAFTSYNFVYLTCIDILSSYPEQSEIFIFSISPSTLGIIPSTLMDRTLDLYFLNTTEHFGSTLNPGIIESLIIPSCSPYLSLSSTDSSYTPNLHPLFEAAHSVMLSIIATPSAAELASKILPFYIDSLFKTYPAGPLTARQFRLAMATLVKECSPPSLISTLEMNRNLVDVIMEILYQKAETATEEAVGVSIEEIQEPNTKQTTATAASPALPPPHPPPSVPQSLEIPKTKSPSPKETYIVALLDSLPYLDLRAFARWLPLCADLINTIYSPSLKSKCRERLWEMLSGELDIERAEVAVRWWGTGGREAVVEGRVREVVAVMEERQRETDVKVTEKEDGKGKEKEVFKERPRL